MNYQFPSGFGNSLSISDNNSTPIYSDNYSYITITRIYGDGGEYLVNNQPWENIEYSQGDYYITNK